jgi:5,10-methylenetetrahydromethanopterin reductase
VGHLITVVAGRAYLHDMELSCAFPPGPDVVDHVRLAEELGYRRAWIYDSPALYGDVWMQLTECAIATERIGLGTGVAVPSLRHPMVTAAAVATLERLAPGRAAVALGTGFTGRFVMGQQPIRWADMETYLSQLTGLLAGDTVDIDGAATRMIHPPGLSPDRPIETPILVGANGPKGLGVAERVGADGVVSIFGAIPGWDWSALFAYGTILDDGETLDSARVVDAAGAGGAVIFHGMYEAGPELLDGIPGGPEWRSAIEEFPEDERHLHTHEMHFVGTTERDRASLSADALAMSGWTGDRDSVRGRLEEVAAAGVTEFWYAAMGSDVPRELRAMREVRDWD